MLRIENLEFSYNKGKKFIKDLNLDLPKGKITTILGPNGCGKSTLLSLLSCYNRSKIGDIFIENIKLNNMTYKEIAKRIATVYQHNKSPEDITVKTLISYGRVPHKNSSKNEDERIVRWAINATNLNALSDKLVMSLSGGERQRAFIAMALAQDTEVLLLDEPTTYLDIYHQIEILEMIKNLNKKHNITIIMVLHDINQAIKYSDNIIIMKDGSIIKHGIPKNVINQETIKDVYNVEGFIGKNDSEMYFIPLSVCQSN